MITTKSQQARGPRRDPAKRALSRIDNDPVTIAQPILTRDAAGLFGQLQIRAPKKLSLAGPMGFEPTTSDVTGRRSNRAELRPRLNHPLLHFLRPRTTEGRFGAVRIRA